MFFGLPLILYLPLFLAPREDDEFDNYRKILARVVNLFALDGSNLDSTCCLKIYICALFQSGNTRNFSILSRTNVLPLDVRQHIYFGDAPKSIQVASPSSMTNHSVDQMFDYILIIYN